MTSNIKKKNTLATIIVAIVHFVIVVSDLWESKLHKSVLSEVITYLSTKIIEETQVNNSF